MSRAVRAMVKKAVEWHATTECITTPSQIRTYIDSCKDWLLAPPSTDAEDDEMPRHTAPINLPKQRIGNIGVAREDIHADHTFECFVCGASSSVADGRIVNANPFTRSQSMLACTGCTEAMR